MYLKTEDRDLELVTLLNKQPYQANLGDIQLNVHYDVFPSDFGLVTPLVAKVVAEYNATIAMDMGCGTGYFAIRMHKNGIENIWAVDNHMPAICCTTENFSLNKIQNFTIVKSDLFNNIPELTFDLIVFNQPYYPSNGIFGLGNDGGKKIIERFFSQVIGFINSNSKIIMPFSSFAGEENNPAAIATSRGFNVRTVLCENNKYGVHFVYEITLSDI